MKIHIGTSGWHYKHWLDDVFYPSGTKPAEMFQFYAQHFDTVEINNSFYHLPSATTFDNWRDSSPPKFLFAVKASRFITHMKKLKDPVPSSEKFFHVADRLGKKLGPVLFQLPPRWKVNVERFAQFLESLPGRHKYVFEFRDETWFVPEVYALLRRHKAAFCIHDFSDMKCRKRSRRRSLIFVFTARQRRNTPVRIQLVNCARGLSELRAGAANCRPLTSTSTMIPAARQSRMRSRCSDWSLDCYENLSPTGAVWEIYNEQGN